MVVCSSLQVALTGRYSKSKTSRITGSALLVLYKWYKITDATSVEILQHIYIFYLFDILRAELIHYDCDEIDSL